jgi:hypothetical protein
MDEQTARSLAKDLVQTMLKPFFSGRPVDKYPPLNLIDLMYCGAYFTRSMVQFGSDPLDDEIYSIFETFPPDLNRVEDILVKRIMAGKEDRNEIIEAINRLKKRPGSYRRQLSSMLKDVLPGGTPGRGRKIDNSDLPRLADLSNLLLPAIKGYLRLRKEFPQSSTQLRLDFLVANFPEPVNYLAQHLEAFERLVEDKNVFRTAKTEKSRSRLIADAMAGCEFKMRPSYAHRKAKDARRKLKVGSSTTKAQN